MSQQPQCWSHITSHPSFFFQLVPIKLLYQITALAKVSADPIKQVFRHHILPSDLHPNMPPTPESPQHAHLPQSHPNTHTYPRVTPTRTPTPESPQHAHLPQSHPNTHTYPRVTPTRTPTPEYPTPTRTPTPESPQHAHLPQSHPNTHTYPRVTPTRTPTPESLDNQPEDFQYVEGVGEKLMLVYTTTFFCSFKRYVVVSFSPTPSGVGVRVGVTLG